MFFRSKPVGSYRYLQIVHSVREGKKVRQQVIATLGRLDLLEASGQLERLMRSGLRHCESFRVKWSYFFSTPLPSTPKAKVKRSANAVTIRITEPISSRW